MPTKATVVAQVPQRQDDQLRLDVGGGGGGLAPGGLDHPLHPHCGQGGQDKLWELLLPAQHGG